MTEVMKQFQLKEVASSKSDHFMNEPGCHITRRPFLTSPSGHSTLERPMKNAWTVMCGRAVGLAGTGAQSDDVVILHVCARCQDSRWELTLAQGESVACFQMDEDSRVCCGGREQKFDH